MDVVEIPRTGEKYRALYDVKGRFTLVKIGAAETDIKLVKVTNVHTTTGRVPVATTHDGRRIRYASYKIARGDTLVLEHGTQKVREVIKMRAGRSAMVIGGANRGRVGTIVSLERHPGAFDLAHMRDAKGQEFITRKANIFVIGTSDNTVPITLPKLRGVRQNVIEEREQRLVAAETKKSAKHTGKPKKR
eukprot:TRINITY_DN6980_c0_g1_i2.p2 TRINITY_DN6980_c0_g1~~TRINITY_DN6980_c0_g1_i2.p2  ORF type:complete len:190 (-),score=22.75 TRINITY_DN6980_c0_g1_i2:26-595(-)